MCGVPGCECDGGCVYCDGGVMWLPVMSVCFIVLGLGNMVPKAGGYIWVVFISLACTLTSLYSGGRSGFSPGG